MKKLQKRNDMAMNSLESYAKICICICGCASSKTKSSNSSNAISSARD